MLNRYQGNTGKVVRVEEPGDRMYRQTPQVNESVKIEPTKGLFSLPEKISELLPKTFGELETEDIILLLILYLMYRDSGDSELLIIMGAMFLL